MDELELIAYKLKIEEFITSMFQPANTIGEARYTYTTNQLITLLESNFTDIPVEIISDILKELQYSQTLFDHEFVWLLNPKN